MSRYLPKSLVCFREGFTRSQLLGDLFAGLTVGVIALPLAMAFGIASIPENVIGPNGISPPAMGLYTAVVAGFLISALGGSRVQVGGPTGAFIVIIYGVAARHGYAGLATATVMAGVIVILMGVCRLGAVIKFIPYPVTTGFTAGIAVIIFSSQIKDFAGLGMGSMPANLIDKWHVYFTYASAWNPAALTVGAVTLALLVALRRLAPRVPAAIVAIAIGALLTWGLHLQVDTIGSRFGGIPHTLPVPQLSAFDPHLI